MQPCLVQRRCHDAHEGRTASAEEMPHSKEKRKCIDFLVCLPGQSVVLFELLLVCTMKEELCCVFCLVAMCSRKELQSVAPPMSRCECFARRRAGVSWRTELVRFLGSGSLDSLSFTSPNPGSPLSLSKELREFWMFLDSKTFRGVVCLESVLANVVGGQSASFLLRTRCVKFFRRTLLTLLAFETASCADRNGFGVRFAQLSF